MGSRCRGLGPLRVAGPPWGRKTERMGKPYEHGRADIIHPPSPPPPSQGVLADYLSTDNLTFLPLLRVLRVLRIIKLVPRAKGLRMLMMTLVRGDTL